MARRPVYNLGSLNLKINPLLVQEGDMIRSVNLEKDSVGALKKRPGFTTYLGTPDNAQVNSLWSWKKNDSTTIYTYRASGSAIWYSTQGTGDWTICGNGTITDGAHVGHAVLDDTMIVGDGTSATRHTTNGTSFTNTTAAPLAEHFAEYQGRIWAARGTATSGTATDLIYSTTGTATDWSTDSSSIRVPGPGRINSVFKANDRLVATKDPGLMFRYDGFSLADMATDLGPSSPYSIGEVEDFRFWINRLGVFGYGGAKPEITSNAIERQIYNDAGEGVVGTVFDSAPGIVHRYDYFVAVGTVTDDLTDETIDRTILKYDYQLDEWHNYEFAVLPTAFHSYTDLNGDRQLIFGDSSGQCYTFGGSNLNDNGTAVSTIAEFVIHAGAPDLDKKWNYFRASANPSCQAKVQFAISDTFTKRTKNWFGGQQFKDGVFEYKMPSGSRGKLLFVQVSDSSRNARFNFYGFSYDASIIERK